MIKQYYKIRFKLVSAMNIGGNESQRTDRDVLVDKANRPYIPGSTLAGLYRSCFNDDDRMKACFGDIIINTGESEKSGWIESRIRVYDAVLVDTNEQEYFVSVRDGVALDEYKTARDGSKHDFQVVDPGAEFETYIEADLTDANDMVLTYMNAIVYLWKHSLLHIGSKTKRGLGRIRTLSVSKASFDMSDEEQVKKWLRFCMFDATDKEQEDMWADYSNYVIEPAEGLLTGTTNLNIHIRLSLKGGISIRKYTTEGHGSSQKEKSKSPDYEQLTYFNEGKEIPIIPGTSWAGAFRHQIMANLENSTGIDSRELVKKYFGRIAGKERGKLNRGHRSRISFSESEIYGASEKILTRTAIDRFSSGARNGSLYTERTFYGGTTVLDINVEGGIEPGDQAFANALWSAVADLNAGFLSVGGLTSVGRGLFEIESIDLGMDDASEQLKPIYKRQRETEWSEATEAIFNALRASALDVANGT